MLEQTTPNKNTTSKELFGRLIRLKHFAESKVPGIRVILSCPTIRNDDGLANAKLVHLRNILKREGYEIINITYDHLGVKGLHLNQWGVGKLAMNMIHAIQHL